LGFLVWKYAIWQPWLRLTFSCASVLPFILSSRQHLTLFKHDKKKDLPKRKKKILKVANNRVRCFEFTNIFAQKLVKMGVFDWKTQILQKNCSLVL
jgi:hypothetical protein